MIHTGSSSSSGSSSAAKRYTAAKALLLCRQKHPAASLKQWYTPLVIYQFDSLIRGNVSIALYNTLYSTHHSEGTSRHTCTHTMYYKSSASCFTN
jgi:hypothetical protein